MFNLFKKSRKEEKPKLFYNSDMHCHILPGIDDGSPDVETSVQLVRRMAEWGIRHVVATPHVTEYTFENTEETISAAYNELMERLKEEDIDMDIVFSAEYRMDENFLELVQRNELLPVPGNRLLIENSFLQPFWDIKNLIFQLQLKGYEPILAHPERYIYYFRDKSVYRELIQAGCRMQINLLSLAGYYGKEVQQVGMWLVKEGLVHFIGSDLHHEDHADAIDHFLGSSAYIKIIPQLERVQNSSLFP